MINRIFNSTLWKIILKLLSFKLSTQHENLQCRKNYECRFDIIALYLNIWQSNEIQQSKQDRTKPLQNPEESYLFVNIWFVSVYFGYLYCHCHWMNKYACLHPNNIIYTMLKPMLGKSHNIFVSESLKIQTISKQIKGSAACLHIYNSPIKFFYSSIFYNNRVLLSWKKSSVDDFIF